MNARAVVGRDKELERIVAFLSGAAVASRAMFIEGVAGVGKTALWEEALTSVDDKTTVLAGRSVQAETAYSFIGLGDLLGDVIGGVLQDLPGPQRDALQAALILKDAGDRRFNHQTVGAATLSALKALAADDPLIIAVDDLQWLDRSSARALGFALRRLSAEPIALLATRRPQPTVPVLMLEAALREHAIERLELSPLSMGALGRVIDNVLGVRFPRTTSVRIHQVSGGNPLHALELARALAGSQTLPGPGDPLPVPEDIQALLLQRVGRLPADTRRALLLAALLARPTEETMSRAFGTGWDGVAESLHRTGVADIEAGVVRFSHPLLASAIVASAKKRTRQEAHRHLAAAVVDDEQRARHLALGATDEDVEVADSLEDASRLATGRGAPDAAAELAELARSLTPADRTHDICRRCVMAGRARFTAGDLELAEARFAEASAEAGPGLERAGALWYVGRTQVQHANVTAGVRTLNEALLEAGTDESLRAAIEHDLAFPAFEMGDLRGMLRHANAAAELAARTGDVHVRSDALAGIVVAEFLLGLGLRRDVLDDALKLEDWDEPRPAVFRPSLMAAHLLSWADDFDEARAVLERSERKLAERGDETALPFVWYKLADLDCWTGEWERGWERALEADRVAVQTEQHAVRSATCYAVAQLAAHFGRVEETRTFAEAGTATAIAAGNQVGMGMNMSVLGFLEASLGNHAQAVAILGPLVEMSRDGGGEEPAALWFLPELIECLVAEGELERAEALTGWLEERAQAIDRPRGLAGAARCRALLAAARGQSTDALAACEEALVQHDRIATPFERARTLMVRGQIARRARKWGLARSSLDEARAEFERLGAALWLERAEGELARIGGRTSSRSELSESEQRVAELLATGKTNREIAEALYMSPRTVSATLSRVYRKIGVSSRTELVARLAKEH